jgi:nicotinate-nucleotide--dimethylbenzimidazole phosphoribosyltransferase
MCIFAKQHKLNLLIVDAGVNADLISHPGLINAKIGKATKNFFIHPAMTADECKKALQEGSDPNGAYLSLPTGDKLDCD